jgi:FkbM family methyltransferase
MVKRIKSLAAKVLANSVTGFIIGRFLNYIVVDDQLKIDVTSKYISNTIKAYLFWGMYESAESRCIRKHMLRNFPVVELGASMGVITSVIAKRKPSIHIAVEANPNMIPLIKKNININNLKEPVIENKVISYSSLSTVKFRLSVDNTGSSISNEAQSGADDSIIDIQALTLSEILDENNIKEYVLVSDIEGAEASIFYYDEIAIMNRCKLIIIELHNTVLNGKHVAIADIVDMLINKYKFQIKEIDGDVYVFEH